MAALSLHPHMAGKDTREGKTAVGVVDTGAGEAGRLIDRVRED